MRSALGRARGWAALLLLALSIGWVLLRRRAVASRSFVVAPPETPVGTTGVGTAGVGKAGVGTAGVGTATEAAGRDVPATDAGAAGEPAPATPVAGETAGVADELPDEVLATDAGLTAEPAPPSTEDSAAEPPEIEASEAPTTEIPAIRSVAPVEAAAEPPEVEAPAEPPEIEASEAPTTEIPAVAAPSESADDLRAVRGIGPWMEGRLLELGITTYRQLANLEGDELERVRAALPDFRSRIEREDWVGQARELHREKYGEGL